MNHRLSHVWIRPALCALLLALASCNRDAPPRLEPPQDSGGNTVLAPDTSATSDNGMLTVDPAIIDLCVHPDGLVAADVRTDATATGTDGTEIWLESDGERKVWSGAGATFEGRTGVWLRDGSKVILVDLRDGDELASLTLVSRPCIK